MRRCAQASLDPALCWQASSRHLTPNSVSRARTAESVGNHVDRAASRRLKLSGALSTPTKASQRCWAVWERGLSAMAACAAREAAGAEALAPPAAPVPAEAGKAWGWAKSWAAACVEEARLEVEERGAHCCPCSRARDGEGNELNRARAWGRVRGETEQTSGGGGETGRNGRKQDGRALSRSPAARAP